MRFRPPQSRLVFVVGLTAGLILAAFGAAPAAAEAGANANAASLIREIAIGAAGAFVIAMAFWAIAMHRRAARTAPVKTTEPMSDGMTFAWSGETLSDATPDALDFISAATAATAATTARTTIVAHFPDDASALDAALDALIRDGAPFEMSLGDAAGRRYRADGRPHGSRAQLTLRDTTLVEANLAEARRRLSEMEQSEAALAAVLNAAPLLIWRRNASLELIWTNAAYAQAVDAASPADAVAEGHELTARRGDTRPLALARAARDAGEGRTERRFAVIGGTRRALDVTEQPSADGLIGYARDMTQLVEVEASLERHLSAHSETLDQLRTGVAIFGADRRLKFFNQALVRLWGLPPEWLASEPEHRDILDRLRERGRIPEPQDYAAWRMKVLSLYQTALEPTEDVWHLNDGSILHVVCRPHPLGGLLFLYEDATDQVALERKLNIAVGVRRATLDRLGEGLAVFGPDGFLQLSNPAFVELWRLDPARIADRPHVSDIINWCQRLYADTEVWDRIRASATSGDERRVWNTRMFRLDGKLLDATIAPLPDGSTMISFADMSDGHRIEMALRERAEALEAADHMKTEFLGHISYQLRTPLNTIIGFGEILDQEMFSPLSERQREYVGGILRSSSELLAIINDIIDLAALEAGALDLNIERVDVHRALSSVAALVMKRAQEHRLRLSINCPEGIGEIPGDEPRIKQIMFNLLSNALKYTEPQGHVVLGAARTAEEVAIWVEDDGAGIAAETLAKVFESFRAGHGVRRGGAGLGLSLVKRFVELHGGRVEIGSKLGEGTRVTCRFPTEAPAQIPTETPADAASEEAGGQTGEKAAG